MKTFRFNLSTIIKRANHSTTWKNCNWPGAKSNPRYWDWLHGSYTLIWLKRVTALLVERWRVRLWSGRSWVQISGRSNRRQCRQRLATAATFLWKELCCPGAMTRRRTPQIRYTLRRNTTSIMKQNCKSGRAFQVGFGSGLKLKVFWTYFGRETFFFLS